MGCCRACWSKGIAFKMSFMSTRDSLIRPHNALPDVSYFADGVGGESGINLPQFTHLRLKYGPGTPQPSVLIGVL